MRDCGGRVSPGQGGVVEAGQEGEGDQAAQQGEAAQRQVLSEQSQLKQYVIYFERFKSQAKWKIKQGSARPPSLLSMFGRLPVPLGPVLGHRLAQVGGAVVAGQAGAGRQSLQPGRAVPATGAHVHQEDGRGGGGGQRHLHLPANAYIAGFRPNQ